MALLKIYLALKTEAILCSSFLITRNFKTSLLFKTDKPFLKQHS